VHVAASVTKGSKATFAAASTKLRYADSSPFKGNRATSAFSSKEAVSHNLSAAMDLLQTVPHPLRASNRGAIIV